MNLLQWHIIKWYLMLGQLGSQMLLILHVKMTLDAEEKGFCLIMISEMGKNWSLKKDLRKNKQNRTPFRMHCVLIICRSRSYVLRERAVISLGEDWLSALTVGPVLQWGVNDKWWLSMEESKSIQIILETFHRRFINVSEGKAGTDREKWRAENS